MDIFLKFHVNEIISFKMSPKSPSFHALVSAYKLEVYLNVVPQVLKQSAAQICKFQAATILSRKINFI